MEYSDKLPPGYAEEVEDLIFATRNTMDIEIRKRLFDEFSEKFTTLDYLWRRRINLEIPDDIHPIPRDAFNTAVILRDKAMKHFYCPNYLSEYPTAGDELRTLHRTKRFRHCYRLQSAECLWSFCPTKFKGPFFILTAQKLEKFLIFPHSQLYRFYRFYQMNSATPLPKDIEEKYQRSVKSYNYMCKIAMEPEKWLEWMYANFEEKDFADNFECKIGEHWYMKEIWGYYINYLISTDKVEVLDVYRRYCRLFIKDEKMRHEYFCTIEKFKAANFDVDKWLIDQTDMAHDLNITSLKCEYQFLLNKNAHRICANCFEIKFKKYLFYSNSISYDTTVLESIFNEAAEQKEECFFCERLKSDKEDIGVETDKAEKELSDSLLALKAIKIQYTPFVTIQFKNSIDPPIPRSIFNYMIDYANHQILSKLYKTCKYFYIREQKLLCNFMYISQTYSQTFVKEACFTKIEDFKNPNIQKYCSGISLQCNHDKNSLLLSQCLSKLCLCSLKCLVIGRQNLTLNEYEILISGGKIEQAQLRHTEISKKDGKILVIEEILKMLPNVVDLLLRPTNAMFSSETSLELAKMNRSKKFESFKLYKIPESIDLPSLKLFLKNNLLPKAIVGLKIDNNVGDDFMQNMEIFSAMLIHEWVPFYEAPIMI